MDEEDDKIMSPNVSDIELAYRKARALNPLRYRGFMHSVSLMKRPL